MDRKKKSAAKSLTSKEMKKVKGGNALAARAKAPTGISVHSPISVGTAGKTPVAPRPSLSKLS